MIEENLDLDSSVPAIAQIDSTEGLSEKIEKAYEYYNADNITEALNLLLSEDSLSKLSYVQVMLGNCYRKNNDIDKAMSYWQKAIEMHPAEFSAYLNIGNVLYSKDDYNNAIECWTKAFALQPENLTVNVNLAAAYDAQGQRIKATKFFERYIKFNIGKSSQQYEAIKDIMSNLRAKADFYAGKFEELKTEGNLEVIVALYMKIISAYANVPNTYLNLANIFLFDKNFQKALEYFLIYYKHYTNNDNIYKVLWNIAELYEVLGSKTEAYCYFKRCESTIPKTSMRYKMAINKAESLKYSAISEEKSLEYLQNAQELEAKNLYEDALIEYENSLFTSPTPADVIQLKIDRLKLYINPEPIVIADIMNKINDCMNARKYKRCIELCDRIILLDSQSSPKVKYAVRCKTECKRLMMAK